MSKKIGMPMGGANAALQEKAEIPFKKGKIRIEPSPYLNKLGNFKIKMTTVKIDQRGEPAVLKVDENGVKTYVKEEKDVERLASLPGTSKVISAVNTRNGLNTGLTHLVDNPYKDLDEFSFYPDWGAKHLRNKPKVTLQLLLEYEHDKPVGYYRNNIANFVSNEYEGTEAPFFARPESKVTIGNNALVLDLAKHTDEVLYYMLKARKDIANSYSELDEDPATYRWVMVDQNEKDKRKVEGSKRFSRATAQLVEIDDLNDSTIIELSIILGSAVSVTRDDAFAYIKSYFEKQGVGSNNLNEFTLWYNRWKNPADRNHFKAAAMLGKYCEAGIVRKRDGKYYWTYINPETFAQDNYEFTSRDHIIKTFLLAPERQTEVEYLKGKYQAYLDENREYDESY